MPLAALLIALYFAYFAQGGGRSGFSHDDLMNLHFAWREPAGEILKAVLFVQTNVLRPVGALFYRIFYEVFRLDPAPYRAFCDVVLWANLFLVYRCAFHVTSSRETGSLTALLGCVQANFFPLYYGSGNCYDIFASAFFYGAFALAIPPGGQYPSWQRCAGASVLYGLGVNAKESAASLPAVVLAYQVLYHPPKSLAWVWREGRAALATGLVAILFLLARFTGPNNLLTHPAYAPSFTLARYLQSTSEYLNETTAPLILWNPRSAALLLAVMALIALSFRSRSLATAWLIAVLGAAPIAIVSPRGLASYCIPLVGYAMYLALLLVGVRRRISNSFVAQAVLFASVYLLLWKWQLMQERDVGVVRRESARIEDTIRQISAHPEWFTPNAHLLIASDSFEPESIWASSFIAFLTAHDKSVRVETLRGMATKPALDQLASYTTIIAWENGRYVDVTDKVRSRGL
jgi:hypothetical protein